MTDKVQVQVLRQGDAACGTTGYMLKKSNDVAAFYLDGWGKTGRIYCLSYCNSIWRDEEVVKIPSICIENGEDDTALTDICFPEFEGWRVHCTGGGKTMAVCLVKD